MTVTSRGAAPAALLLLAAAVWSTPSGCGGTPGSGGGDDADTAPSFDTDAPRPNVLFVILDCVRADHIHALGYPAAITPNLDRFAGEGLTFTRAYAPATWTVPSHASMFTGIRTDLSRMPEDEGTAIAPWTPTMASVLGAHGYRTGMFATAPMFWEWPSLSRGFDHSVLRSDADEIPRIELRREVPSEIHARTAIIPGQPGPDNDVEFKPKDFSGEAAAHLDHTAAWFTEWLDEDPDAPFFAFVHSNDAHFPYRCGARRDVPMDSPAYDTTLERALWDLFDNPERLRPDPDAAPGPPHPPADGDADGEGGEPPGPPRLSDDVEALLVEQYDECIAAADSGVGTLMEALRQRGKLEDTLLIVAADHGETLGERGMYGHGTMFNNISLGEEVLRVPLFISWPAAGVTGQRDEPISLVDLFPTVIEAAGIDPPPSDGHSLWPAPDAARAQERKLVLRGARLLGPVRPGDTGFMDHFALVMGREKATVQYGETQLYQLDEAFGESLAMGEFVAARTRFLLDGVFAPSRRDERPVVTPRETPRRYNLLVIDLPALRRDRLLGERAMLDRLPTLARLVRESVVFEHAAASSHWTLPALATLLTGRHPFSHGVVTRDAHLDDDEWTLAEVLGARGYDTAAWTGGLDTRASFGLGQGFDLYDDGDEGELRRLHELVPDLLDWIDRRDETPFFALLSGYDLHAPWHPLSTVPPPPAGRQPLDCGTLDAQWLTDWRAPADGSDVTLPDGTAMSLADFVDGLAACYDACLVDVDGAIDELYDGLRDRGALDSTIVVFTSDHGDSLGERGHAARYHAQEIHSEVSRIPLLIRLPRQARAGHRVEPWIGTADLMPTLLDLLGIPAPAEVDGRSLAWAVFDEPEPPGYEVDAAIVAPARDTVAMLSDRGLLVSGLEGPPRLSPLDVPPDEEARAIDDPQQRLAALSALARFAAERHLTVSALGDAGAAPDPALQELLRKYGYWQ